MRRIVLSDIFGKTQALDKLRRTIGADVGVVDPYDGERKDFHTEEQAYDFFMANIGLDKYCDLVQSRLEKTTTPIVLIGFSVGASAIWRLSEHFNPGKVERAYCFYGSQIRHMTEINPRVRVEYILPKHEPGFCVDELARHLSAKKNVVLHKTPYGHGFMNELSRNFSKRGYAKFVEVLRSDPALTL